MDTAVDKRELILSAALALFARQGFEATAVPEIANLAGVGTGTLYRYFPDKHGLVNALYRHWRGAFDGAVLAPMPAHMSARQQFDLYWARVLGWYRAFPDPARFLELHAHESYLDTQSRHAARVHGAALKAFIRSGIEAGTLASADPELMSALLQGASHGLLRQEIEAQQAGRRFLSDETVAQSAERLWRVLAV